MTTNHQPTEEKRLAEARESFSGRLLSDAQFEEAIAITRIIEREINKSGTFKDKLGDYSYAMSRTEKMDVAKAETTIRDLFKMRTGHTMNQMRENLVLQEADLPKDALDKAHPHVVRIGERVREGNKMTFYRAYACEAQDLGASLGITDAAAKNLLRDSFRREEKRELLDWGKELDEKFYRPQIEAEAQARSQASDEKERRDQPASEPVKDDGPSGQSRSGAFSRQASGATSSFRRSAPRLSR